jgi:hypothetical protein
MVLDDIPIIDEAPNKHVTILCVCGHIRGGFAKSKLYWNITWNIPRL